MITIAARLTGTPPEELIGAHRASHLCAIRYAVYLTAREWGYSFPDIGKAVNRDHSTVQHGLQNKRRLESYIEDFDGFCAEVSRWADQLPPFVCETEWQPSKVFEVYIAEYLRQRRAQWVRKAAATLVIADRPKGPGAGVYDHDMAYSQARDRRIRNGSDQLLAALRAAA